MITRLDRKQLNGLIDVLGVSTLILCKLLNQEKIMLCILAITLIFKSYCNLHKLTNILAFNYICYIVGGLLLVCGASIIGDYSGYIIVAPIILIGYMIAEVYLDRDTDVLLIILDALVIMSTVLSIFTTNIAINDVKTLMSNNYVLNYERSVDSIIEENSLSFGKTSTIESILESNEDFLENVYKLTKTERENEKFVGSIEEKTDEHSKKIEILSGVALDILKSEKNSQDLTYEALYDSEYIDRVLSNMED